MASTIDTPDIPEGFQKLKMLSEDSFIGWNGPLYSRRDAGGRLRLAARVETRHCNPMQICHGGWLATLMDMTLPLSARAAENIDHFLLTISMSLDYLAAVPLGAWVEGEARVLKRTKRMVFVEGLLSIAGEAVVRGSGVFRIGPLAAPPPV